MQLHTKNDAIAYFWRCNCIKAPKVTIVIIIKKKELKRWGFTSVVKKQSKFFGITFFFVIFAA